MSNARTRDELIRPFAQAIDQFNAQHPNDRIYMATGGMDPDQNRRLASRQPGSLEETARLAYQDVEFHAVFEQGQQDTVMLIAPLPEAFPLDADQLQWALDMGFVLLSNESGTFEATGSRLILLLEHMTLPVFADSITLLFTYRNYIVSTLTSDA